MCRVPNCLSLSLCRAQVALNATKFTKYHALPTSTLIELYKANAEHDCAQSLSSTEDVSETKRLVSDQQHMLVTVLRIRAAAAASTAEDEGYQQASAFLSSLGTAAFGLPPASLHLPAEERLIATANCRREGTFGTLVSSPCYLHRFWYICSICLRV